MLQGLPVQTLFFFDFYSPFCYYNTKFIMR